LRLAPRELILQSEGEIGCPLIQGTAGGMQIAQRMGKNVAIRNWRRAVGEYAAQRHEKEERLL
jgi:hypothetical protein